MGRIIAVTNLKGGIGKTTTVVNVSAGFALKGARVLLVDVDAQGNLAMALGVKPRRTLYEVLVDGAAAADCITTARPNLDILAADESLLTAQPIIARRSDWPRVLEQALRPLRSHYDLIVIDCGGSLTVLNLNALMAASDVLVPTTVEPFSLRGLEMLLDQIKRVKGSSSALRAIVPTMFDPRLRQSVTLLDDLRARYGDLVMPPIRVNVRLSESSAEGRTIYEFDPRSRGAADYAQLVEQLSTKLDIYAKPVSPPAHSATVPLPPAISPAPSQSRLKPIAAANSPTPVEPPAVTQPHSAEQPVVTGGGDMLGLTCPNCGKTLHRATVAGYRVTYCDNCKYRRQELASGIRR